MTATLAPAARTTTDTRRANDIDDLIRTHLPLVGHLVREVANRVPAHVNRDDLTSAGMFALAAAARTFDPELGVPFVGFASLRIRGALTDELRSMDWASRTVRSKNRTVQQARESLTHTLGREPSATELADHLGMTARELGSIEADVHRATVLPSDALGPTQGLESLVDPTEGPESALLRREQMSQVREAIAELPERLRTVVEEYFLGQRLMADIARDLGVTESRVSQLRGEALAMMREALKQLDGNAEPVATGRGRAATTAAYCAAVADRCAPARSSR